MKRPRNEVHTCLYGFILVYGRYYSSHRSVLVLEVSLWRQSCFAVNPVESLRYKKLVTGG